MTGAGASRVLWVTEEPPDRTLGGGSIRQAHLLEALAAAFPTDLLLAGSLGDLQVRRAAADVTELPKRPAPWSENAVVRRALELGITLCSPYPSAVYPAGPSRRALVEAAASRATAYRLVCVEHEALAPIARAFTSVPSAITFHHLVSEMVGQSLRHTTGTRQRWFLRRDLRKARRMEARAVDAYDRVIVCSSEDAHSLARLTDSATADKIRVVPNGVDTDAFRPTDVPSAPRVLFPGSLAYAPNVDGAAWFCAEVWPRVHDAVPGAELTLAGRDPVPEVTALAAAPGVSVHANVPSMAEYFARARVVVVPLRVGTGTRLKALEAMASGRPVVGTTVGLEGIGAIDGTHALVRDDPAAMAAAVIQALQRDDLAVALGDNARMHVERSFGWDRIGAQFVAAVSELLTATETKDEPAEIRTR
jgi:polysaccharide biosynthesis protein PslH